ncbi:MAG TPA: SipW-dependent-type signal peptide-containing protein [Acidimicrobiia bacterium]|nr:SipW-dependent-type signal peptide-containing protein [Acidimicrobiia bacterium]
MRRILLSVLLTLATLASLVTGATYAPFSDIDTAVGGVQAGSVDVVLNSEADDEVELEYAGPHCGNLAHGESCGAPLAVRNAGSLSIVFTNVVVDDQHPECFSSVLDTRSALLQGEQSPAGDPHSDHNANDVHAGTLTTTLDGDADECQGRTNTVLVTIRAQQSPSPHD